MFLGLLTVSSAGWAASFLATGSDGVKLNDISNRIMSGDDFRLNPLSNLPRLLDSVDASTICLPLEMRATAIIRVRQYEDAVGAADTRLAEQRAQTLHRSIDRALACVPTEGFLWFARYWNALTRGEFAASRLDDLRMSYMFSPFEGWIALRRSPYMLAIYETLPDDIKKMVASEFVAIAASGFSAETSKNLRGPGWPIRDQLLPRLGDIPLNIRQALSRRIQADGATVEIPGVEAREFRPWQ